MILFAYGGQLPLDPLQLLGGPDWIKTQVFNIEAKLPKSLSDQVKPPLRAVGPGPGSSYPADVQQANAVKQVFRLLLVNRFKLQVKHETKVLPVYDLVLAGNGPKMAKDETANRTCQIAGLGPKRGFGMDVRSCPFRIFAGLLSGMPELRSRVLVDKTGLHGRYSFKVHWTREVPDETHAPTTGGQSNRSALAFESSGPSVFSALREQLGLRVVPAKAPVDVIVIEHIERPTLN